MSRCLNFSVAAIVAVSAGLTTIAKGQVPERPSLPPTGDPAVLTPARSPATLDPVFPPVGLEPGAEVPAAVRPGTIQREPTAVRTRTLTYSVAGEAPVGVQVASVGPRSVTLQWTATAGAQAYWVHQSQSGGPFYRGGSSTGETVFTVTRLLPGTAYSFKVSAAYPQEMQRSEGMSEAVSATTAGAPAVTGLTASVTEKGQVSLAWNKVPDADWYRLFRNGAVLSELRPVSLALNAPPTQQTAFLDQVGPGSYGYQIQAVYVTGAGQITSDLAPVPPVSVTIKAGTRVRYCQTTTAPSACGLVDVTPTVVATASTLNENGTEVP